MHSGNTFAFVIELPIGKSRKYQTTKPNQEIGALITISYINRLKKNAALKAQNKIDALTLYICLHFGT